MKLLHTLLLCALTFEASNNPWGIALKEASIKLKKRRVSGTQPGCHEIEHEIELYCM